MWVLEGQLKMFKVVLPGKKEEHMRFMDVMEEYKQKVGVTEKEDARDM